MKPITLNTKEIKAALPILRKITGTNLRALPILSYVYLKRTEGATVRVQATDVSEWATYYTESAEEGPAGVCIHAADLAAAINLAGKSPSLSITQTPEELKAEGCRVNGTFCRAKSPKEAPKWPALKNAADPDRVLPAETWKALHTLAPFVSADATRRVLTTVLFKGTEAVATDGKILGIQMIPEVPGEHFLLIPSPALLSICKGAPSGDLLEGKTSEGSHKLRIRIGRWELIQPVVEGNYPNYRSVFPDRGSFRTEVRLTDPENAQKYLEISTKATKRQKKNPFLNLFVEDDRVWAETFLGRSDFPAEVHGPFGGKLPLNPEFFEVLLSAGCTFFRIVDNLNPVQGENGKGLTSLIMPLREVKNK